MKGIVGIIIVLFSFSGLAQTTGEDGVKFSNEELAILSAKKLALQLDLTKEQETQVKELYFKRIEEREELLKEKEELKEEMAEEQAELKAKGRELMEKHKAELKKILTAEQFLKWEELQEKIKKSSN